MKSSLVVFAVVFAIAAPVAIQAQCFGSNYVYVVDHNLAPTDQGGIVRVDTATGAQEVITQGNYLGDVFLGVQESPATLLVANGGGTLLRIDLINRTQTVVASGLGHATSQPAVDPCGNIYVPDDGFGNPGGIYRISPVSGISMFAPGRRPFAIVYHPNGYLYFSALQLEDGTPGVGRLDPATGEVTDVLVDARLAGSLAIDLDGNLIVANGGDFDPNDNYLSRLNLQTRELTVLSRAPGLACPRAAWVDRTGRIFVANSAGAPNSGAGLYELGADGNLTAVSVNDQFKNVTAVLGWPPTSASAASLQVAALRSALDTANGTIAQLTTQNQALTAQVATLNGQVSDLNAAIAQLKLDKAALQQQLAAANALIASQQADAAKVTSALGSISQFFASTFNVPSFTLAGSTSGQKVQALCAAIQRLNHGQQQALFLNLGGQK